MTKLIAFGNTGKEMPAAWHSFGVLVKDMRQLYASFTQLVEEDLTAKNRKKLLKLARTTENKVASFCNEVETTQINPDLLEEFFPVKYEDFRKAASRVVETSKKLQIEIERVEATQRQKNRKAAGM